jgi:hypothetical protein
MTQVTGQRNPGRGKTNLRPSHFILIISLVVYVGARVYAAYKTAHVHTANYEAAMPVLALNSFVGDLKAFYVKQRPLRFPKDLTEVDAEVWKPRRQAGRPDPEFTDSNRTYVVDNYKYVYTLSKNPGECGIFAAPLGPRREEANTIFILVTAQGVSRTWKGAALQDKDLDLLARIGIPSESQLSYLGLIEQKEPPKPAK